MAQKDRTRDMTTGSPMKLILGFAAPLLFGFLFQQFYSFVDTAIVGRYLGADKLAAVGGTGSLNFMVMGFVQGACAGFAIPIAQAFGAKDDHQVRKCVASSVYLAGGLSVLMAVLTVTCILLAARTDREGREGMECRHIVIRNESQQGQRFMEDSDVLGHLQQHFGPLVGRKMKDIDLHRIEESFNRFLILWTIQEPPRHCNTWAKMRKPMKKWD